MDPGVCDFLHKRLNRPIRKLAYPQTYINKKGQLTLTNPRDACETFARFM